MSNNLVEVVKQQEIPLRSIGTGVKKLINVKNMYSREERRIGISQEFSTNEYFIIQFLNKKNPRYAKPERILPRGKDDGYNPNFKIEDLGNDFLLVEHIGLYMKFYDGIRLKTDIRQLAVRITKNGFFIPEKERDEKVYSQFFEYHQAYNNRVYLKIGDENLEDILEKEGTSHTIRKEWGQGS